MRHNQVALSAAPHESVDEPQLVSRQERSRSIDDQGKYQAIKYLEEVGLFTPLNSLELYHGRSNANGDDWKVSPGFRNDGDSTSHDNVNKVSALATDTAENAQSFADERSRLEGGQPEVHRIISEDADATIIDGSFSQVGRSAEEKEQIKQALTKLRVPFMVGAPLDFEHRDILTRFRPQDFLGAGGRLPKLSDLPEITEKLGIDYMTVRHIAGAMFTQKLMTVDPVQIVNGYLKKQDTYQDTYPINQTYVASWLRNAHVVGVRERVRSATILKDIEPVFLFDLAKVDTEEEVARRRQATAREFGDIAIRLADGLETEVATGGSFVDYLSNNLYATPEQLVDKAKEVPGYRRIYEADAGNWEEFTLEEHTETVLRNFDNNYADKLPADLLPIIRLALLTHDLGKPESARRGDKRHQHLYNVREADQFMQKVDIKENMRQLITGIIGEGQHLTTRGFIRGDLDARTELLSFCRNLLTNSGVDNVTENDAKALADVCLIIQTCDSAAYTDMAITTSKKHGAYRNWPTFNDSFYPPVSITKQDVQLKYEE